MPHSVMVCPSDPRINFPWRNAKRAANQLQNSRLSRGEAVGDVAKIGRNGDLVSASAVADLFNVAALLASDQSKN